MYDDGSTSLRFAFFIRRFLAILILGAVSSFLVYFPYAQIPLSVAVYVYAALLYIYPNGWLVVLPAILPVLDLAPWTGWFFLDELDLFVATTLAVGLWRWNANGHKTPALPRLLLWSTILLTASYTISMVIGLLPLQPLDANAFSNYYSHYNSLRMAKGYFEALALFALFQCQVGADDRAARKLVLGMLLGLLGTVVAVIWERFIFVGLLDFASQFRVTATFSGLHNGGNDLEAYLVMAQPFVIAWMIFRGNWSATVLGVGLLLLSTYSLFVTFSRAGLLAIITNCLLLILSLTISFWVRRRVFRGRALFAGVFFSGAALVLVALVVGGPYFRGRLAAASVDWDYRLLQSQKTIAMMRPDWQTRWFGMGLGRYPEMVYLNNPLNIKPATYRLEIEQDHTFLRLTPGSPLYFGQWINPGSPEKLHLRLRSRSTVTGALTVYLCEKTLQYSFGCEHQRFAVTPSESWTEQHAEFNVGSDRSAIGHHSGITRRPIEFAIANSSKDGAIDVDQLELLDGTGNNIIRNGDFRNGLDRWFFTVDDHTPWQNWNHWVQLYFDQGWLGVTSSALFVLFVLGRLSRGVIRGEWLSGIGLAAISSFMVVGIFGFLFDTPRMALLFYFIAMVFGRGLEFSEGNSESPDAVANSA